MKKIDSFALGQYLSMYGRVLPVCLFMGAFAVSLQEWFAFFIIMLLGLVLPVPATYLINKVSEGLMFFYNGGNAAYTLNEQLAAEVEKVKVLKGELKFTDALQAAEAVLAQNPEHHEALFLKAQILSQGFEKYKGSNTCLNKLLAMNNPIPDLTLRKWAITLRKENLERIRDQADLDGQGQMKE